VHPVVDNPLYDQWRQLFAGAKKDHIGYWTFPGDTFEERFQPIMESQKAREELCKRYAWAIPTPEVIEAIAQFSPLVELGAGRGYWASLIQKAGGEIDCFDEKPPDIVDDNIYHPNKKGWTRVFTKVHQAVPEIVAVYPEATLFLCWPPYDTPMAFDALRQYEGKRLVFVGEGDGGCCGNAAFWELLQDQFEEVLTLDIPNWWSIRDYVSVWERK